MNCNDYLWLLEKLPADEVDSRVAREHVAACPECGRVTRIVAARERESLAVSPGERVASALVAARHRKVRLYYRAGLALAITASAFGLAWARQSRHSTGPVVRETFLLQCLSPEQAAEVLRPYVGASGRLWFNPRSPLGVLNAEVSPDVMAAIRSVIDRYDNPDHAQCTVGVRVPKVVP